MNEIFKEKNNQKQRGVSPEETHSLKVMETSEGINLLGNRIAKAIINLGSGYLGKKWENRQDYLANPTRVCLSCDWVYAHV